MPEIPDHSAEVDNQYHMYRGNEIPWYVRVMWLGFWVLTAVYVVRYMFPAIQSELFNK
jgi:hypothetical protein